jgi:ectoine hydroxylase-related dioxygenase (phytanoyl-CoA dioxygenase family)
MEITTYGVSPAGGDTRNAWALACEEIRVRGFTILESVLDAAAVSIANEKIDEVYRRQCAEVGGEASLDRINDADIVRCLLAYDDHFLQLATLEPVLTIIRSLIGENLVLMMQNGVINRPDRKQFQTSWHRDLNYQHWVSSRPLALSALVCLEDFEERTGGTAFLPASHRFADFPSPSLVHAGEVTPNAPAGSVILFDAMIFHRSGINRSGRVRRAINHVFGCPILGQQIDIPAMLGKAAPADPWLAGFLGYRWNPAASVLEWRGRRIAAAEKLV